MNTISEYIVKFIPAIESILSVDKNVHNGTVGTAGREERKCRMTCRNQEYSLKNDGHAMSEKQRHTLNHRKNEDGKAATSSSFPIVKFPCQRVGDRAGGDSSVPLVH